MRTLFVFTFFLGTFYSCVSDSTNDESSQEQEDKETDPSTETTEEPVRWERIDGPANVRDTINGEILFSFEDNVLVETSEYQENPNWIFVGRLIQVNNEQEESNLIRTGEEIYDEGELILKATKDVIHYTMGRVGETDFHTSMICGYTYKDNIKPESVPERELEKLLNKTSSYPLDYFEHIIWNFEMGDGAFDIPNYTDTKQYSIYGSMIDDPSPIDRLRLVFQDDMLIAVVHERPLDVAGKTSYEIFRGLEVMIIQDWDEEKSQDFVKNMESCYFGID